MTSAQEKAADFLLQMIMQKRGNLRFLISLYEGIRTSAQFKEMGIIAHTKIFEYMALITMERLDKGVKYTLTEKGMAIMKVLHNLLSITADNLPR